MSDDVLVERSDGLVTVTINRPERKNALDAGCWQALDSVLAEVATSPADRALLLTGAGGNFSSGADLSGDGSAGLAGGEMQLIVTEMRIVGEIIRRLQRLPKPTLAAVDGFAVGVAFGLALACDLVVASDRARIVLHEPQFAVTPGQAAVFYDGDTIIGGGWITHSTPE